MYSLGRYREGSASRVSKATPPTTDSRLHRRSSRPHPIHTYLPTHNPNLDIQFHPVYSVGPECLEAIRTVKRIRYFDDEKPFDGDDATVDTSPSRATTWSRNTSIEQTPVTEKSHRRMHGCTRTLDH